MFLFFRNGGFPYRHPTLFLAKECRCRQTETKKSMHGRINESAHTAKGIEKEKEGFRNSRLNLYLFMTDHLDLAPVKVRRVHPVFCANERENSLPSR